LKSIFQTHRYNYEISHPLERADENRWFEVLSWGVFECGDGSAARVAPAPQTVDFQRAFERNRVRIFFGYFLLSKQKKVTHRQVKSLLSDLALQVINDMKC
jgi:hypothetical protein